MPLQSDRHENIPLKTLLEESCKASREEGSEVMKTVYALHDATSLEERILR
jgi:hypothetical protein